MQAKVVQWKQFSIFNYHSTGGGGGGSRSYPSCIPVRDANGGSGGGGAGIK